MRFAIFPRNQLPFQYERRHAGSRLDRQRDFYLRVGLGQYGTLILRNPYGLETFRFEAELCGSQETLRRTFCGCFVQNHAVAVHRLGRKEARQKQRFHQRHVDCWQRIEGAHVRLQVGHWIRKGMPPPRLRRTDRRTRHHAALRRKTHGQPPLSAVRLDLAAAMLHSWPQGTAEAPRQKKRMEFSLRYCRRLDARRTPQEIHIVKNWWYETVRFCKQAVFQRERPKDYTDKVALSSSSEQRRDGGRPPANRRSRSSFVQKRRWRIFVGRQRLYRWRFYFK